MSKKETRFEKIDTLLIRISLCLFLFSTSWLVYDTMFNSFSGEGHIRIGSIDSLERDVKRKFNRSMIWYASSQGDVLFEKDWIFTGSASRVVVAFDDGGTLSIEPNSLVILSKEKGRLQLNLQHGSFLADVKGNANISVFKNGQVENFKTAGGKVKVTDSKEKTEISVIDGLLEGENQKLEQDQKATFDGQNLKIIEAKIELTKPAKQSAVWLKDSDAITFEWEPSETMDGYKIEIANNEEFKDPIVKKATGTSATIDVPFKTRLTYWRVTGSLGQSDVPSSVETFEVKRSLAPILVSPIDKSPVIVRPIGEEKPEVEFAWKDSLSLWPEYELQMADNKDFNTPLLEVQEIPSPKWKDYMEKGGEYFWRVRGVSPDDATQSPWSTVGEFTFTISYPQDLAPIQLDKKSKEFEYIVTKGDVEKIDEEGMISFKGKNSPVTLSWSAENRASRYKVIVASDPNFKNVIHEQTVTGNSVTLDKVKFGQSFYKIVPEYDNGDTSPPVEGTISAFVPVPKSNKVTMKGKNLNLKWSPSKHKTKVLYEVRYTHHKEKGKEKTIFVEDPNTVIKRKSNFFAYQVRAVDPTTKQALSEFSKMKILDIKKFEEQQRRLAAVATMNDVATLKKVIVAPQISKPPHNKTFISYNKEPPFIVMRWKYTEPYDKFELEVGRDKSMNFVVFKKEVRHKKLVLKQYLKSGIYYYRIRAMKDGLPKSWSPVSAFRVIEKSGPKPGM